MTRGEIVTVALSGDYGKPRPAVIIQSDQLVGTKSVLICPLTTSSRDAPLFRVAVEANAGSGLSRPSQIMADKLTAVRRDRVGRRIGSLDEATLMALDQVLAFVVGIADRAEMAPAAASIDRPDPSS